MVGVRCAITGKQRCAKKFYEKVLGCLLRCTWLWRCAKRRRSASTALTERPTLNATSSAVRSSSVARAISLSVHRLRSVRGRTSAVLTRDLYALSTALLIRLHRSCSVRASTRTLVDSALPHTMHRQPLWYPDTPCFTVFTHFPCPALSKTIAAVESGSPGPDSRSGVVVRCRHPGDPTGLAQNSS